MTEEERISRARQIIIMKLEGHTYDFIGKKYGISRQRVMKIYHRLYKYGEDSSVIKNCKVCNVLVDKNNRNKNTTCSYECRAILIYPRKKIGKHIGTIYLVKEYLGVGYIAHECFHAILDFSSKKAKKETDLLESHEWEEKICWYHGDVVKQIVVWLNDKNLWD